MRMGKTICYKCHVKYLLWKQSSLLWYYTVRLKVKQKSIVFWFLSVFEKQHTCTSSSGRSFQDFQLWEIAEELHVDKLIPLSLRLGMTYARICRIRKESNLHSVNVCYNVIMQWQKEQTSQNDQVETLARILDACHERRKAYKIRKFSVDSCCSND